MIYLPLLFILVIQPVNVVYVNQPDIVSARAQIAQGFAYWQALGPCTPQLYIASETYITVIDPLAFAQYRERAQRTDNTLTLFIINNADTLQPIDLGGGATGFAFNDVYSSAIVITTHYKDANGLYAYPLVGMALAHELGHRLYTLPDGRAGISIMNFPDLAFNGWRIHAQDYSDALLQC